MTASMVGCGWVVSKDRCGATKARVNATYITLKLDEPRYEKTGFLHMQKQRHRSASRLLREADQRLCFRYSDSMIPPLSKSKISRL